LISEVTSTNTSEPRPSVICRRPPHPHRHRHLTTRPVSQERPLLRDTAAAFAIPAALYAFVGSPLPLCLPSTDTLVVWWNTVEASPAEAVRPVITGLVYLLWIAWAWHALWTATALAWVTFRLPALVQPGARQRLTPAAAVQALALGSMLTTRTVHAAAATASTASTTHVQNGPGRAQRLMDCSAAADRARQRRTP